MGRIQADMGNPVHGVSRQPDERKFKGQCREQINARSNLSAGLETRAGFLQIGELVAASGNLQNAKWGVQERGDGTSFITAYTDTIPEIFDLEATRHIFNFGTGAENYYNPAVDYVEPAERFGVSNILDTTFITNRSVVPLGNNLTDEIGAVATVAWIQFKVFSPGTEINLSSVNWTPNAYPNYFFPCFDGFVSVSGGDPVEPDRNQSKRTREYDGATHAKWFVEGFPTAPLDPVDIPAEARSPELGDYYNNWVRVSGLYAEKILIAGGGESLTVFYSNDIDAIEKLPPVAFHGDICRIIEGQGEDRNTGYFKAFHKDTTGSPTGLKEVTWKETVAPTSDGTLDEETMPFKILRSPQAPALDIFTMEPNTWNEREVGDKDNSPYPSFILDGTPIQSVGIFQNRLFLAAGEIVHQSRSDEYYDVWKASSFYNTDADPFEVFADTEELNIIQYAEQFDGDLIFFSVNGQFILPGSEVHTYNTSFIQTAAQYRSDLTANPVLSGDNIFFAIDYGNFAGVREFYTDNVAGTKRSRPITEHVEDYIEGRIRHLTTSTNIDALLCLADIPNEAYVYEWRWSNNERVQSSWSRWRFKEGTEVLWMGFVKSSLFAVVKFNDKFMLWRMEWDDTEVSHGLHFAVGLDGRFEVPTVLYDSGTDTSSWNVTDTSEGYDDSRLIFVEGPESEDPGFTVEATQGAGGSWTAVGDISGVTLIAGLTYETSFSPATPLVRDHEGIALGMDRLQLNQLLLNFKLVGKVYLDIIDDRGNVRTLSFNNRRINNINNQASLINTEPDTWKIPIRKKTKGLSFRLYTDDITPFTLISMEWMGEYKQRGRRVS